MTQHREPGRTAYEARFEGEISTCIACARPILPGERILPENSGGVIHVGCCGPEREGYVDANGDPLPADAPIPEGFVLFEDGDPLPWEVLPEAERAVWRQVEASVLAAASNDGWRRVPQRALDWLFGEGPDEDGVWFGDATRPMGAFWWRSVFRKMVEGAAAIYPASMPEDRVALALARAGYDGCEDGDDGFRACGRDLCRCRAMARAILESYDHRFIMEAFAEDQRRAGGGAVDAG